VQRSKEILEQHREELDRLANALLEHELLDREEILTVISGDTLLTAKKTRSLIKKAEPQPSMTIEPEMATASSNMDSEKAVQN
jgi:hypothetical protein